MKCTIDNLFRVFYHIIDNHTDMQSGADFGDWDDESDLMEAVRYTVERMEREK